MEKREFSAEIGKVLDLMINALYTNKEIFLRELISNASDACDKRRYLIAQNQDSLKDSEELKISVKINADKKTITISDSGIGMDKEDMVSNLGTIASSGTQRFFSALSEKEKPDLNLIGQFGVGFYSAFMVADKVEVVSKKAGSSQAYKWISDGKGSFEVGQINDEYPVGTEITLYMKDQEVKYLDKFTINHIIDTYSNHIAFPIELNTSDKDVEVVNKSSAIWMRSKSEITDEQYNEFYHHIAHQPDTPWMKIHHKIEGALEYSTLLYIPSMKPFDLFHPDRKTRVKLYIKRVFITDDIPDIIPRYLRFLRGVVDSEDLPLNISRQTMQQSSVMDKIRKSLVKKILSDLLNKSKSDIVEYEKFWENFGEVLKEGLCEPALEEKEQLLEISRFHSIGSDNLISLDDYISKMHQSQQQIFYITGDDVEKLKDHPMLDGFKKRSIDVLLLNHYVDDFWVNVINVYKGKEFKSISQSNIDLDSIATISDEVASSNAEDEKIADDYTALIDKFKTVLGASVKDVIISKKLSGTPACLAIPEGHMSSRMEKMLIEQKQLNKVSAKILELNPKDKVVSKICRLLSDNYDDTVISDMIWLTYDQACLLEGDKVSDPKAFVARLNSFIGGS